MKSSRAWLEYLEGELSPSQAMEMEMLLLHSATDRRILRNLEKVRSMAKETDPAIPPAEPAFFDALHDKIMARVEKTEIEKPVVGFRKALSPKWIPQKFKSWLSSGSSLYMIMLLATYGHAAQTIDGSKLSAEKQHSSKNV